MAPEKTSGQGDQAARPTDAVGLTSRYVVAPAAKQSQRGLYLYSKKEFKKSRKETSLYQHLFF
jgi:hypothetical protein